MQGQKRSILANTHKLLRFSRLKADFCGIWIKVSMIFNVDVSKKNYVPAFSAKYSIYQYFEIDVQQVKLSRQQH